jgi:hypothetical protein
MRWLFLALALLAALPAHAESRVRSRLSTHRQPAGDVAARYRFVGRTDGTWDPSFSRHARPTVTGPATTVDRGDGTAVTVPANTLAVGPDGALVYPTHTQSVLHTNDPTQVEWIKEAGVTVEKNSESCPIGPLGDRMHLVTAAADAGIYQSWTHSATAYTVSAWLARATADADCTASLGFFAQAGLGYTQPTLTATPTRISKSVTSAAVSSGIHLLTRTGDTCSRLCFWGANETNTGAPYPYSATGAAPLSVAAHDPRATSGLLASDTLWSVRVVAMARGSWSAMNRGLVGIGNAGAHHVRVRINPSSRLYVEVSDADGGLKTWFSEVLTLTDGSEITAAVEYNAGTVRAQLNGVWLTMTSSGTGTGIHQPQSTLYVGQVISGVYSLGGAVRSIAICRSAAEVCR